MTAEIAILNKSAVALAADSAVTLQTPGGHKIYNTVNKLFTLSKYRPVGIMVYGNSEFMGIPWESIIKEHRRQLGTAERGTLKEYTDEFVSWLEQEKALFPESLQNEVVTGTARNYFAQVRDDINAKVTEILKTSGSIAADQLVSVVEEIVASHEQFWQSKARLSFFPQDYEQRFLERQRAPLEQVLKEVFEKLSLPKVAVDRLIGLLPLVFSRDHFQEGASGIVVAGFGGQEVFPSVFSLVVDALAEGSLKWKILETAQIGISNAAIIPFAQREMVDTFLTGVDPQYKKIILESVSRLLQQMSDEIFKRIPDALLPKKSEQTAALSAGIPGLVDSLDQLLNAHSQKRHIAPIMNAVGALPKDELAAMAESLVNLTSFKRRVSIESETVGGEIDVAVISKGDGFIWIKRKHYFDAGKNPHFMVNYYR
ncbi:MAG: hypothetical protein ABI540_03475 [Spartobacteria bacterium]